MNWSKYLLVLCLSLIVSLSARASTNEVSESFLKYRNALLQGNGSAAWEAVDFHTHKYYEDILKDSISLPKADFDRLNLISKFTIIRLRVEYRKEKLKTMTGKDFFIEAANKGWISKSSVQRVEKLVNITIDGNKASGSIPEQPDIPLFHFIKEKEGWKLALTQTFEIATQGMKAAIKNSGMSENDFILAMTRKVSKFEVSEKVFDGPIE